MSLGHIAQAADQQQLEWLGDSRGVPHAYRMTSETVDVLTICTPAGIERFFRAAGQDLPAPRPDGWAQTPAILARAAAEQGRRILGPPLGEHDRIPPPTA